MLPKTIDGMKKLLQKDFKTVDMLVITYVNSNLERSNSISSIEVEVIKYIVRSDTETLLYVLQQETNIPSKYDMQIINAISHAFKIIPDNVEKNQKMILEIYKNRKDAIQ